MKGIQARGPGEAFGSVIAPDHLALEVEGHVTVRLHCRGIEGERRSPPFTE